MNTRSIARSLFVTAWIALAAPGWAADAPSEHEPAAGHGGQSNIFAGDLGNVIWTTLVFGIVVVILGRKAWPPLIQALNERENFIRQSQEQAKKLKEDADKLLADYKAQLDRARLEASAIVDEGRRDAEVVRKQIQEQARKESDEMVARAKREIKLATDAAITELYDRASNVAIDLAGGLIRKSLNTDEHRRLAKEALEQIRSGPSTRLN